MSKFNINNKKPIVVADNSNLLKGIQGNILAGHGRNYGIHVFITFSEGKVSEAKSWIQELANNQLTSAYKQEEQRIAYRTKNEANSLFTGFSLSTWGYGYLGYDILGQPNDSAFIAGMKNRQPLLGDPKSDTWDQGFQSNIHAVVLLASDDDTVLNEAYSNLQSQLNGIATISDTEYGEVLYQDFSGDNGEDVKLVVNHFGYVDGVSQPLFFKRQIENSGDTSVWDPFAPLSQVLSSDPNSNDEYAFGSLLAYRKLHMNPQGFSGDVVSTTKSLGLEPTQENFDLIGAYAVGRFKNGTPVINSDKATPATDPVDNNFIYYKDDFTGSKCPFHSHTRKTNPRYDTTEIPNDGPSITKEMERGHRIARRAISYTYENDGQTQDQGLLFLCYQSNLADQFEFIQGSWADENNFVKQEIGQDTLIGQGEQIPTQGQNWPTEYGVDSSQKRSPFNADADLQKRWIVMKGGEYFFSPSMNFLQNISN